jgi:hypothetical protein
VERRGEEKQSHLSVEGKIRKRVSNPIGLILTQQILRIKNTKPLHDRISKRISVSFSKGASNGIYEEDMINISYPVSLSWPSNGPLNLLGSSSYEISREN